MALLLSCALMLCLPLQQGQPPMKTLPVEQVWEDLTLDNGLRVSLIHAPDAESQVVFTLLPWGLLDDAAGELQRSHLVEHILVHSADPTAKGPEVGGVLRNGETTAISMRLETFSRLDAWREGLARHARWLTISQSDSKSLAPLLLRERPSLQAEVLNTSAVGLTHKWAIACWNQVVRHGLSDLSVSGDSVQASWDSLLEGLTSRVHGSESVQLISVGPIDQELQKKAIEELFGSLPTRPWKSSTPSLSPAEVRAAGDREATWDLERTQYMVWYPMPDETALDRVAADALSAVVNARLQQRGTLEAQEIFAFCSADLVTPEGRWLLLSVSLPSGHPLDDVVAVVDEVVGALGVLAEAPYVMEEMVRQLSSWPDFSALRREAAGNPNLRWIEASQTLFMVYAQVNMGLRREELLRAYQGLDRQVLEALVAEWVIPERRSTLVLRPGS
ncbi:MAG: hypothetical protein ACI9EF_002848 [Pseudohongiellaceae bacterium]|jgi:hypothetical protein